MSTQLGRFQTDNEDLNDALILALKAYNAMELTAEEETIVETIAAILKPHKDDLTQELWDELMEATDSTLIYDAQEVINL